jgi:hypothetical protein
MDKLIRTKERLTQISIDFGIIKYYSETDVRKKYRRFEINLLGYRYEKEYEFFINRTP